MDVEFAVRANGLGVRYRRGWAVRDCSFALARGTVTALVGANGAGKSTLLRVVAGLQEPTGGTVGTRGQVAFVAQDKPLYRSFTVAETLRFGQAANPSWDRAYAERLVAEAGLPPTAKVHSLSGGHRARLALVLALGRRPDVLLLDEPMAEMDPVAREVTARALMLAVAETGLTVVLSSHAVGELEDVCDHLLLLDRGAVRLAGEVDELVAGHRVVVAPRDHDFGAHEVVSARAGERQVTAVLRVAGDLDLAATPPGLTELVVAYLRSGEAA
ncbi:ABC transporter ATP-binding protein [Saccharothrix longispora]|uniref:ABC-2 type transport system ATP-binding protein n=1 Tax=Saccharothrix longispora TaxID=33920 RepID=A0ABU1PMS3_9PSEU|nr:ABC transporter ATP-binding protein [Saccharothrix longispora]MDR6591965.1 ABC-2 type transport system ATP-binding protein [Saccharothrix longispora]